MLRALAASYDALAGDDPSSAACYLELAALRPGAGLTEAVLLRLWSRVGGLDPLEVGLVIAALERRLLIHRHATADGDRLILHSLHADFVRLECPNAAQLEAALIASYRTDKGTADWSALPDDGYVFEYLIDHLDSLGDRAELVSAVSGAWIRHQAARNGDLGQARDDVWRALRSAGAPPIDLVSIARLSLLAGQVAASLRRAPFQLIGALAEAGDVDQALRWAADKPDPDERFAALLAVAKALLRRGDRARAQKVVRAAADCIPLMGSVVEVGMLAGLTALNAVHALVRFPFPDQWEGTSDANVALARVPLDALVQLAPVAAEAHALFELVGVSHPFWELYGHLIPLVAVELLADNGEIDVAAGLLGARPPYPGDDDPAHADQYRYAVALAAIGRFEEARAAVEALVADYHAVGYSGLARHLAAAGRADEALALLPLIDDDTVAEQALMDVAEASIDHGDPAACERVAAVAAARGWLVAEAWLLAASGDAATGSDLLDRARGPEAGLGLGVRLAHILHQHGHVEAAREITRRLAPLAVKLVGPQWFAPETTNAEPSNAALMGSLLLLLAETGEPIPDSAVPLGLIVENQYGGMPNFKLSLLADLAIAGRVAEAREIAATSMSDPVRALGLATVLSVAAENADTEEIRRTATNLIEVAAAPTQDLLDSALGAAMRALLAHKLHHEAAALLEQVIPHPSLWAPIGVWALDSPQDARVLVRRLLVQSPLKIANTKARAALLVSVAGRSTQPRDELDSAIELLGDARTAAGALDVVFDVVDICARTRGVAEAESFARGVANGPAASIAEQLLHRTSVTWRGDLSEQEIAAAAVARAVAAAGMGVAISRTPGQKQARSWLHRSEELTKHAARMAPGEDVSTAVAKYVGAAQVQLEQRPDSDDPISIAWLLSDLGCDEAAERYALQMRDQFNDFLASPPQAMTTGEFEWRSGIFAAVRAAMGAIIAMRAVARGDLSTASAAADAAAADTKDYGWLALELSQRTQIEACVALGLHAAGASEAAQEHLAKALVDAPRLARRGELSSFRRLTQALVTLRPPGDAASIWATWLTAAAAASAENALFLIADYLRWLPSADIDGIGVQPATGELFTKPVASRPIQPRT